ncbi:uncharacterized protein N7525_001347 [Penicillium rubens]|uniref:uncharacterized protein n=1 Tax=Penicillium rubens TaxID=1108849 RepID=UPI002A5A5B2A|nr:uncharacterized protein N7525_001347 [Penicillium rubens]KAJ5843606.1 hypothetical protein N7525_001347 [Penicillium rubens]
MAAYWCDELFQLVGSVVVVSAAVVTGACCLSRKYHPPYSHGTKDGWFQVYLGPEEVINTNLTLALQLDAHLYYQNCVTRIHGSRTVDNMEDVILPRPDIMSTFNPATNTLIIKVLTHTYQQVSMVLGHLLVVELNP